VKFSYQRLQTIFFTTLNLPKGGGIVELFKIFSGNLAKKKFPRLGLEIATSGFFIGFFIIKSVKHAS
jgi:hypothetical protein